MSIAAAQAQNGNPARGWNLNSFTGINACAPVPVVVKPSTGNTYAVSFYGEANVANSLNAYVKDGQVYVENTAPFNTAKGVGVVLTMPADKLSSVNNKGTGGSASFTAVSGFTPSSMTVNTIAGSGPTVLGMNNASSSVYISHASTSDLRLSGEVGTVEFSTTSSSGGNAVFNAVSTTANINVASTLQTVYVGGATDVLVTGSSLGTTTFSNGTCNLSDGTCTEVPPQAVAEVTMPVFKGASVAQICSCSGGCQNPPPPPPPPPQPQPRPSPPSPVGQDCASRGPNCYQCCQDKRSNNPLAYYSDSSCQWGGACYSRPPPPSPVGQSCASRGPNCYQCCQDKRRNNISSYYSDSSCQRGGACYAPPPPTPTPTPLGSSCSATGPDCQSCCQQKYYNNRQAYNNDASCQEGGVCAWQPYSTGFIGRKLKA